MNYDGLSLTYLGTQCGTFVTEVEVCARECVCLLTLPISFSWNSVGDDNKMITFKLQEIRAQKNWNATSMVLLFLGLKMKEKGNSGISECL